MESLWLQPISLSFPFVDMLYTVLFLGPSYQTDMPREDDNCDELMDSLQCRCIDRGVGVW